MVVARNHPPLSAPRRARVSASLVVCPNRLLLERSEVVDAGGRLVARLPAATRARDVRGILGTESGATVRAGILDAGAANATVRWTPSPTPSSSSS